MKDIETTLELRLDFSKGLVPVVTQNLNTREVLILAFSNEEAFRKTQETGLATYWSRSRNKLWTKGEESGNYLLVRSIFVNCEQNSLLYLAEPMKDGACHVKDSDGMPFTTCYYRRVKGNKLEFIY
jgi:phosphoribosyl-AMP cyclohydrolase